MGARSSRERGVGVLVAVVVGLGWISGCSSSESPPELERIDQPAQVDEERLGGQPGAVNDSEQGG